MYPKQQTFFVLGLSRSGVSAAEYLLANSAVTYIYDDVQSGGVERNVRHLVSLGAKTVEKEELSSMHEKADVLVLSPGIPIDHPVAVTFKRNRRAVIGETELAARVLKTNVIAVTGTNGKTTTVSMIEKILTDSGLRAKACGNIGEPLIHMTDFSCADFAVAEISSFQMETLSSLCPHVAVVLNVTEDHLNRHYNMDNYVFLKRKLLKNSTEAEYAVLNYDDEIVRQMSEQTKAKIVWFSLRQKVQGGYLENGHICFEGESIMPVKDLLVEGPHNIANALAAVCAAKLVGVESGVIAKSLAAFRGIKHRVEWVDAVDGVEYINDSKGTNVDATMKAVACMKKPCVLLLGGKDKGYDYEKLFAFLRSSCVKTAILYGENRFSMLESALKTGYKKLQLCDDFRLAVWAAKWTAKSGDCVLLSPASASFDEFDSYEQRGDQFVAYVRSFKGETTQTTQSVVETNEEIQTLE